MGIFSKLLGAKDNKAEEKADAKKAPKNKAENKAEKKLEKKTDAKPAAKAPGISPKIEEDYRKLTFAMKPLRKNRVKEEDYVSIAKIVVNIESRAGNAGNTLLAQVAGSFYKFCNSMAMAGSNIDGFDVVRLHFAALEEIINGKFDVNDKEKSEHLTHGLEALSQKVTAAVEASQPK